MASNYDVHSPPDFGDEGSDSVYIKQYYFNITVTYLLSLECLK